MARKKQRAAPAPTLAKTPVTATGSQVVFVLALMLMVLPAVGVPHEEMLQDTLKSMLLVFFTLGATLFFFWQQRRRHEPLHWHGLLWFPLLLAAYALGSMVWSHTYLAGVEAIRWSVFALLLWLGLNTLERELLDKLATGAHVGAVIACFWGLLQFWFDFGYFPQGPNPASTFVNRNFAAEFVVCVLPFSAYLLLRARSSMAVAACAFTTAFNIVFILATGTRSALITLLLLAVLVPLVAWLYRDHWAYPAWGRDRNYIAGSIFISTVLVLGSITTGNAEMLRENETNGRGVTALARGLSRTLSVGRAEEYTQNSFSVRWTMWKATGRMIADRPLTGVGAGAWEVDVPRYQAEGAQLETDYYVHNEILQLLAEYGLVGWLALIGLLGFLLRAAWRTLCDRSDQGRAEGPVRSTALLGLFSVLMVSNAGFPWRLATTGALFALYLAVLAASDLRQGAQRFSGVALLRWRPLFSQAGMALCLLALALAAYISQQAAVAEHKLIRAVKLALTISQSGQVDDPRWEPVKREMLQLLREGTAINPHYRKVTPMAADELARWGDWKNAVWIWESVAASRPYVVALLLNIARGHSQMGEIPQAMDYLERSRKLQPNALALASIEVVALSKSDKLAEAAALARRYFAEDRYDLDLVNVAWGVALRSKDWDLGLQAMQLRIQRWPELQIESWLRIANVYAREKKDDAKALEAFRAAVAAASPEERAEVRKLVPEPYQARL
jgi:O-antigen ligase